MPARKTAWSLPASLRGQLADWWSGLFLDIERCALDLLLGLDRTVYWHPWLYRILIGWSAYRRLYTWAINKRHSLTVIGALEGLSRASTGAAAAMRTLASRMKVMNETAKKFAAAQEGVDRQ